MGDSSPKNALIVGRLMRFLLGAFFVYEVYDVYLAVDLNGILIRASWAVALILFYQILHLIISKYSQRINPVLGAILAFAPVVAVFFFGYGGPAATGALTFLGLTLIIAAIRADPGCEVMSIPALFSKKHTHLVCILFSPLDWIEKNISTKGEGV